MVYKTIAASYSLLAAMFADHGLNVHAVKPNSNMFDGINLVRAQTLGNTDVSHTKLSFENKYIVSTNDNDVFFWEQFSNLRDPKKVLITGATYQECARLHKSFKKLKTFTGLGGDVLWVPDLDSPKYKFKPKDWFEDLMKSAQRMIAMKNEHTLYDEKWQKDHPKNGEKFIEDMKSIFLQWLKERQQSNRKGTVFLMWLAPNATPPQVGGKQTKDDAMLSVDDEILSLDKKMLRETPFILSHDAGTGYLPKRSFGSPSSWLNGLLKTQERDFKGQLDCGARALDLRWGRQNKADTRFKWHHDLYIDKYVDETLPQVIDWANDHPNELVLLVLSHCQNGHKGVSCLSTAPDLLNPFRDLGIHIVTDKKVLQTMTVEEAKQMAKNMKNQGSGKVLAIMGDGDWIDSTFGAAEYIDMTWWGGKSSFKKKFETYETDVISKKKNDMKTKEDRRPWILQAIPQTTPKSVTFYAGLGFNNIRQTTKSGINTYIAEKAEDGKWRSDINFVMMNNVHEKGPMIANFFKEGSVSGDDACKCSGVIDALIDRRRLFM